MRRLLGFDHAGIPLDSLEAFVYQGFKPMIMRLRDNGIPATIDDYGAGTHSWPYWQRDLHRFLPLLLASFANTRPAPATAGPT